VKVSTRHGRLRLRLEPIEVDLLLSLLDQLEAVIDAEAENDPVRARLFPSAYRDDPDAAAEYRSLTEETLTADRVDRIGSTRAELAQGGDIDLTVHEVSRRWIQVLNDLRLALGTRLGVTEDDRPDFDPEGPDGQIRAIYHWLTAVQDSVVSALLP
jgi:uncharacterized protein DUF2017